jgi:oligopeptide/dipeptide ABC transporter ATP-binding protein
VAELIRVEGLKTYFPVYKALVQAVDGISFHVDHGEMVGLVGESGSGKSVTGMSIMGIVERPGRIEGGEIYFKGENLIGKSDEELRGIRGNQIGMIFQNPRTCLNPVLTIGEQITRIYSLHRGADKRESQEKAIEMLNLVNIPDPSSLLRQYSHQLSGGMCQRVMIVMALICDPDLIIADEPTTGLDVTIQKQILALMREVRERMGAAQLLITHDLGVVAETCDRVVVMYAGKIMEDAPTGTLFKEPAHPYTQGLLRSIPRLDKDVVLEVVPGYVPSPIKPPPGCRFHPRCSRRMEICESEEPPVISLAPDHRVACHLYPQT